MASESLKEQAEYGVYWLGWGLMVGVLVGAVIVVFTGGC